MRLDGKTDVPNRRAVNLPSSIKLSEAVSHKVLRQGKQRVQQFETQLYPDELGISHVSSVALTRTEETVPSFSE